MTSSCSSALPSSLELGSLRPDRASSSGATATQVKYELQALVFYEDIVQAAISQEIKLYDSTCVIPPPLTTEHYPGEFRLEEEKRGSKAFLIQSPKISIKASEPEPCVISSGCRVAEVTIPLQLQVRNCRHSPTIPSLRMKSTLHGTTLISTEKMGPPLSRKDAARRPFITELRTSANEFTREAQVPRNWQERASGSWTQHMNIRIPLVVNQVPIPTFSSAFVSRRYSLSLRIELCGGGGNKFSLKVPVHIMYSPPFSIDQDLPPTYAQYATHAPSTIGLDIDSDTTILQSAPPPCQLPLYVR